MLGDTAHEGLRHAAKRRALATEFWQSLAAGVAFIVFAALWLFIVYLPGRTLERWEDQRQGRGGKEEGPGRAG